MRVRAKWSQKGKEHSLEETAGVIAINAWKAAGEAVLSLENEGFETSTQSQRLDAIGEFCAFLLHCADRLVYGKFEEEDRQNFVTALAVKLVGIMQDNRQDANGPGDYRKAFIDMLNARMDEYSECAWNDKEGPGFTLRRMVGTHVQATMGAKDNKWIADYVLDLEAPKALDTLKQTLGGMFPQQFALGEKEMLRTRTRRNWDT